jgi:hypothetical protein
MSNFGQESNSGRSNDMTPLKGVLPSTLGAPKAANKIHIMLNQQFVVVTFKTVSAVKIAK